MKLFQPAVVLASDEDSAPKLVEELIRDAESARASDIHLQTVTEGLTVAFRLDGLLTPVRSFSGTVAERILGRVKYLARLKTYQESLPQDGRIDRQSIQSRNDVRVATYPTVTGEKIVLRLFNNAVVHELEDLEFPNEAVTRLDGFLKQPSGLLLLTGPAGSGKTTTIYACLRRLAASTGKHVITVEDPVEQIVPGIMQTEINEARGLDFACASRHLLRQDPQALVIGEIRDEETANIAVRGALTGHLMIATLHAGSCRGVLERLLTLCQDHSAIAAALELVVNQRLLRKVCPECSGKGCATCFQTGYSGRVPVVEWLPVDESIRQQIRDKSLNAIAPIEPLSMGAGRLVQSGHTNESEVTRVLGS